MGSEAERAALVHAVAHIELTAVNLALDAVHRFGWAFGLPSEFIGDWLGVTAAELERLGLT